MHLYAYVCLCVCIYMHRGVLKGCVGSLFQRRTQDYRSQMEAGATPAMPCNIPRYKPCPSPSFPSHPLPRPQHTFACKKNPL